MTGFKGCPCHADCVEGCEKCENPICNCKVKDLLVVEAVNLGKKSSSFQGCQFTRRLANMHQFNVSNAH